MSGAPRPSVAVSQDECEVIRERMAELGIDSAELAELTRTSWGGIKVASAKARIDRFLAKGARRRDMTAKPYVAMLGVLGLVIGVWRAD